MSATAADELLALLDRVVAQAGAGEHVEAFGLDATETSVRALDGEVEALSSARSRGIGLRVLAEGRVGSAYTADLSEPALAETLAAARANAAVATADAANRLAEPAEAAAEADAAALPELADPAVATDPTEEKIARALRLEQAARSAGPPVRGVDSAVYADEDRTVGLASTTGLRAAYRRTDAWVLVEVLAERDGATTSAVGLDLARRPDALDIDGAAAEGAERASRLLGGRKPPSGRLPIVLDPFATASLLGVVAGALSAEAVQKGRSVFAGRLGEQVGAAGLALLDDGRLADGPATAPWDGEGVATRRTTLLRDGVLIGLLHNTYTAAREQRQSTGNARRGGYATPPGVGPTNLFLQPGPRSPQELIGGVGHGFYCQQVLGVHSGANPVSGDFSVGAAGVMIRDGALAEPVREATIAGSLLDILTGVVAVGADLRFLPFGGALGGATLLVEGMTLSGA